MPVPDALTIEDFRAALRLWRWQRRMAGQPEGDQPPSRSGIPSDRFGRCPAGFPADRLAPDALASHIGARDRAV
jgi:hypothetical protein